MTELEGVARGLRGEQRGNALAVVGAVLHTGRNAGELVADDLIEMRAWGMRRDGRAPYGLHPPGTYSPLSAS